MRIQDTYYIDMSKYKRPRVVKQTPPSEEGSNRPYNKEKDRKPLRTSVRPFTCKLIDLLA